VLCRLLRLNVFINHVVGTLETSTQCSEWVSCKLARYGTELAEASRLLQLCQRYSTESASISSAAKQLTCTLDPFPSKFFKFKFVLSLLNQVSKKMAGKEYPSPPTRSPLQPAINYGNVPTASGVQYAPSRCMPGGMKWVATNSRSRSSFVVHIKLGDVEKVVGAVKFSCGHTDSRDNN
jgi:hypothetical protein